MFDTISISSVTRGTAAQFTATECDAAVHGLRRQAPDCSAVGVLSSGQRIVFASLAVALIAAVIAAPVTTFLVLNVFFASYFLLAVGYRIFLMTVERKTPIANTRASSDCDTDALPVITILAPLYRDAASLEGLAGAIDALDYPQPKKDVKLLLEADDADTLREARRLGLDRRYEVIVAPNVGPRTKPKACNFGLLRARGDIIVIYDAEDQPETDQLLKAAAGFSSGHADLACLQARLNYYNADENWLTRLFTLEYALWFDWLLPALQRLKAPIPLGGTSNFFKTDILRGVGGWDPFNVTEDADLGLRLARLGYRVEMLDSTTFEEANCKTDNWIRQRSRWIKGHMQTWLVHMRRPDAFIKQSGWHGLLSIQLFLAGNAIGALVNPLLWGAFLYLTFVNGDGLGPNMPKALQILNVLALIIGNSFFILCAVAAPLKRGWRHLCIYGLTAPVYWLLTSLAAYKALWQIVFKPYYWEKTDHMISAMATHRLVQRPQSAPVQ